jgi:mono/diheme cytochrome c family protein
MTMRIIAATALFVTSISWGLAAQEKPKIVSVVPPATAPTDASGMFREYCAACHGAEGRGNGPAAAALKTAPADLTRISARNGGKFPTVKVERYIQGLDQLAAHGDRDMPVWGQVFRPMGGGDTTVLMRVRTLSDYLQKMQQ